MPRLTLVPATPTIIPPCPVEDVRDIINELRVARDTLADGPSVLWLVNDLMLCCESLFEYRKSPAAALQPPCSGATIAAQADFLATLTRYAEDIRRSNGELSDDFLTFIATAPLAMDDHASN